MSSLFDFTSKPDPYAVMGNPIAHSKSPQIHQAFAQQTQQNIIYEAILVDVGGLEQAIGNFVANGGKGLNITVPFKRDAWKFVNERSEKAQLAGAVNTIAVREDNSLYGDNTDGIGLVRDLIQNHATTLQGKRLLLIGAGGAARGVLGPLLGEQPQQLLVANRTPANAHELAQQFSHLGNISGCGFNGLETQTFDIIINATSSSLHGELPPLPTSVIHETSICYDMMYAAEDTVFMQWAKKHGAQKSIDGLGMLVEQAAESFFIWRGVQPNTTPVIELIREGLKA
ncbi:shikimate dehydrogenase [Kaarinaea lacus]